MSVSNDKMLCLRWNNASSKLNLADAFQELRTDSDFFDVSLGCTDGSSKVSSLKAHKVILSAYSNVFKDMLRQHSNPSDPFIYLRGVSYDELSAMLDFMYHGEVYVAQSNLNAFLAMANDLQVKGLSENIKKPTNPSRSTYQPFTTNPFSEEKEQKMPFEGNLSKAKLTMKRRYMAEKDNTFPTYDRSESKYQKPLTLPSIEDIKPSLKAIKKYRRDPLSTLPKKEAEDYDTDNYLKKVLSESQQDTSMTKLDDTTQDKHVDTFEQVSPNMKGTIDDFMFKIDTKIKHGKKMRRMAKCKLCSKEGRTDYVQTHIKTAHHQSLVSSDTETTSPKDNYSFETLHSSEVLRSKSEEDIPNEDEEETTLSSVDDFIENIDKRVQQGIHNRKFSRCKLCSKECRSDNIRMHIRNTHANILAKGVKNNEIVNTEMESSESLVDNDFPSTELDNLN